MEIIEEHFSSIKDFIRTIKKRPNNEAMKDDDSSEDTDNPSWYGTSSYEEAERLLSNGYVEILKDVINGVKEKQKVCPSSCKVNKMIPKNSIVGFAPNVPNAIIGIPESMIMINRTQKKVKALKVLFNITNNCGTSGEQKKKAGIALLSALKMIELSGTFIKLDLIVKASDSSCGTFAYLTLKVKDFHERFDLQKLCFPLANPAMQRRFGFKWLETVPGLTDKSFSGGYGSSIGTSKVKDRVKLDPDTRIIGIDQIIDNKYSIDYIIQCLKV